MTKLVGIDYDAGKALFQIRKVAVVVDINKRDVDRMCSVARGMTAAAWMKVSPDFEYPSVWRELAEAAVTELEVTSKTPPPQTERKFRVPAAVKIEAQQAIDWVVGFERGNSVIGMSVAKQLTTENYISFSKLQRIARYFSRRPQSITENAGWSPGQQGFPTDDRIKFSLWGGNAAREWVAKVEKTHPLVAAATDIPGEVAPDVDGDADVDGNNPHEYVDDPDSPGMCLICGRPEEHEIHQPIVAGAFVFDETCDYFGKGINPDSTEVEDLYVRRPDGTWAHRVDSDWEDMDEPAEDEIIIMLDPESAELLATILDGAKDDPSILPYELSMLNPAEAALFSAADAEIDWELVDRVFDIYDSQERSINAGKQVRGPGGKFGDEPDDPDAKKSTPAETKARLPQALPLVPNVAQRIDQYLADVAKKRGTAPAEPDAPEAEAPVTAAGEPGAVTDVRPLYLAIVDKVDTEAVLDVISLVPPAAGQQGDVVCWKRENGKWLQADEYLAQLRSVTPPPVVELTDDAILQNVLDQVDKATADDEDPNEGDAPAPTTPAAPAPDANPDQHPVPSAASAVEQLADLAQNSSSDQVRLKAAKALLEYGAEFGDKSPEKREKLSKKGYALPDGSYPIETVEDLKNAVQAFGRAKNKNLARQHIIKRARALNRTDLLPSDWDKNEKELGYTMWGPHGEILSLAAAGEGGADRNRGNAEELRRYWTKGEGAAKIQWNTPGDWYRCVSHLSKYLGSRAKGYCTLRHHEVTGHWPGEEENH